MELPPRIYNAGCGYTSQEGGSPLKEGECRNHNRIQFADFIVNQVLNIWQGIKNSCKYYMRKTVIYKFTIDLNI